jgi:hypothetical protein
VLWCLYRRIVCARIRRASAMQTCNFIVTDKRTSRQPQPRLCT